MNTSFISPKLPESCNSTDRLLRVIDILNDEDCDCLQDFRIADIGERLEEMEDESLAIQCLSPRRIISRCLSPFRRAIQRRKAKKIKNEEERRGSGGQLVCSRCLRNGVDGGSGGTASSSSLESVESGRSRKDLSFNLGVGCSLLYLVLASKNELSKMADLRKQMELLLQDVKGEFRRKGNLFVPLQSNTDLACSSTDFQEDPCSTTQLTYQRDCSSHDLSDSQSTVPKNSLKFCFHENKIPENVIDELEAEFESELELLQLQWDVESPSKFSEQSRAKTEKNTNSTRSCCISYSEVIDPQDDGTDGQCGFPAIELERRLHELLEARQEERIEELEGALECAKQEITERELELSWWKETARVISQHVPPHLRLRLASQHD